MTTTVDNYPTDHPEHRDLLIQARRQVLTLPDVGDYYELLIWSGPRVIWRSHRVDSNTIRSYDVFVNFKPLIGESLRVTLQLVRFHHSRPVSAIVRVSGPHIIQAFPKAGVVRVHLHGREQRYHAAIRKVRTIVGRASRTARPRMGNRFPSSSALRPNPEIIVVASTVVNEGLSVDGVYSFGVTPTSRLYYRRDWAGSRTPNFGRIKKRNLPVNPHSVLIQSVTADLNTRFIGSKLNSYEYTRHSAPWSVDLPVPVAPSHLELARNKAIRKLIDTQDLGIDANLAQDFAQINQLTSLIGGTTRKLISSISNLRRGNIPGAVNALVAGRSRNRKSMPVGKPNIKKDLAENWLELQYGWKPLLMDIEGVLKSLPTLMGGEPFVRRATASATAESSTYSRFNAHEIFIGDGQGLNWTRTRTSCRFSLHYRLDTPIKSFMAQLGFTNPINLAWEVLPFSFVVDWFIPIGPYLESLSAWDGLTFLGGSSTQFTRSWTLSNVDYEGTNIGNPSYIASVHSRYSAEFVKLDRGSLSSFPAMTLPQFKNPFKGVTHAENGIALLTTFFRR